MRSEMMIAMHPGLRGGLLCGAGLVRRGALLEHAHAERLDTRTAHASISRHQDVRNRGCDPPTREQARETQSPGVTDGRAAVNRDLARIKAALSVAVQWSLLAANPLLGVKRIKQGIEERVRFLSKAEEKTLRKTLAAREAKFRRRRDSGQRVAPGTRQGAVSADHRILRSCHVMSCR